MPRVTHSESSSEAIWNQIHVLVGKKQVKQAYHFALEHGDDLHLLRLAAMTGSVVRHLDGESAKLVLRKLNKISRSNVVQSWVVDWIADFSDKGRVQHLSKHQKNEILDSLYKFATPDGHDGG